MRAFLIAATLTCVLCFEAPSSTRAAKPQSKAINTQSAEIQAVRCSDGCCFTAYAEVECPSNCVQQGEQGRLFIAQSYVKELEFHSHGLAQVYRQGDSPLHGWMYVDRRGRVIVQGVPSVDNAADEFSDGLVRTVINERYGFANRGGKIVIAPVYEWALPFVHGYALVCRGCRQVCLKPDGTEADPLSCDHPVTTGGEWFKINKADRVVERLQPLRPN